MEIINLGTADDLPPVDWNTIVGRLADGSRPAADAHNARTTWLTTLNDDGSPKGESLPAGGGPFSGVRRPCPHGQVFWLLDHGPACAGRRRRPLRRA